MDDKSSRLCKKLNPTIKLRPKDKTRNIIKERHRNIRDKPLCDKSIIGIKKYVPNKVKKLFETL